MLLEIVMQTLPVLHLSEKVKTTQLKIGQQTIVGCECICGLIELGSIEFMPGFMPSMPIGPDICPDICC
jgi:hypothetical protein